MILHHVLISAPTTSATSHPQHPPLVSSDTSHTPAPTTSVTSPPSQFSPHLLHNALQRCAAPKRSAPCARCSCRWICSLEWGPLWRCLVSVQVGLRRLHLGMPMGSLYRYMQSRSSMAAKLVGAERSLKPHVFTTVPLFGCCISGLLIFYSCILAEEDRQALSSIRMLLEVVQPAPQAWGLPSVAAGERRAAEALVTAGRCCMDGGCS